MTERRSLIEVIDAALAQGWADMADLGDGSSRSLLAGRVAEAVTSWQRTAADRVSGQSVAEMLVEFHDHIGQHGYDELVALFRVRLMAEEFGEYIVAAEQGSVPEIAKELADMVYVAYGTAELLGIDLDRVVAAVHAANMTKTPVPPGVRHNEVVYATKAIKGDGYVEVDMGEVRKACGAP